MKRPLLTMLTILLLTGPAHAAAPPPQWLPQDSWPGRKQYDARLEKTVKLWGTGVPAAEVFASIAKQTGVALGFSPPDDDNARLCLNVYLNPKEPPTLRDLLVQLGWVMDCAWAVEGEGDARRYVLLHTDMGRNVLRDLQMGSIPQARERGRRESEARERGEQAAFAKLREIGESLDLSRDETIRRHKGKDNLMLLALLDPAKRAMAQLCLSFANEEGSQFEKKRGLTRTWEDLSPEQQALVRQALEPGLKSTAEGLRQGWMHSSVLRDSGWSTQDRWDDWEWVEQNCLRGARLEVSATMGFLLNSERGPEDYEPVPGVPGAMRLGPPRRPQLPTVWLLLDRDPSDPMTMQQDVGGDLYHLLGERVEGEEDPEVAGERAWREGLDRERQAAAKDQLNSLCHLSPAVAERLSSLRLPVKVTEPHALWQLQEAVAALSGLHVISDHFWQPARTAKPVSDLLGQKPPAEPDALLLLRLGCVATESRDRFIFVPLERDRQPVGWEWGDAGGFLRFRSADRDVWRAAFLPADVVDTLHDWLAPRLPEDLTETQDVAVPLDPRQCGALLKRLTYLQRMWGGVVSYGRPALEAEQWRTSFRREALAALRAGGRLYVWLSVLDDEQWKQAHAEGLRIGTDFAVEPDPEDRFRFEDPPAKGATLRLRPVSEKGKKGMLPPPWQPGSDWCYLELSGAGIPQNDPERRALATQVTARPERLPHLVPLPEEYMQ